MGVMDFAEELGREIWLCGDICTGKDFVADVLVAQLGYRRRGVGALIAAEIEAKEKLPAGFIYDQPGEKGRRRTQLQEWGNMRRREDPHYWLKAWCTWRDWNPGFPVVQTSCRFIFEAQAAFARNAVVIKMVVPEDVRRQRIALLYPEHKSENDNNAAEGEIHRVPYHFQMHGTLPYEHIVPALLALQKFWHRAGRPVITPPSEKMFVGNAIDLGHDVTVTCKGHGHPVQITADSGVSNSGR